MGDSLDLGRLADNLPSSNSRGARAMQAAEVDLQSAFRNSALCITQMLKAGQKASKRSYQAGYSTALQDVLEYLQSSLDINVAQQRSNEGIAQVIDYIEARQEAVRLELQDLEADEEQQQQHAQSSSSSSNAHPQAPSSAQQSFRSLSHLRQEQQQQQHQYAASTSYRDAQQQYHPVASTSGTSGASHHASGPVQHQRKARSNGRSTSPAVSRTVSTSSQALSSSGQVVHNRPSVLTSAAHQRVSGDIDAERTQESIPLASSSSIPNSPEARFSPEISLHPQATEAQPARQVGVTPPQSTANGIDASLSNTSTAVSPLTRLQAKRERERYHDRRSRGHGHGHGHSHTNAQETSAQGSSASAASAAGVKRRWTASLLPEHHTINLTMNLGAPGEHENDTEAKIEEEAPQQLPLEDEPLRKGFAASANEDGTGMEMDDASYRIDGNARPSKRISRR